MTHTAPDSGEPVCGESHDHLWPCGCIKNDAGAHRGACPVYEREWHEGGGWIWIGRNDGEARP